MCQEIFISKESDQQLKKLILNVVLNKNDVNCFRILLHVMQIIYDDTRSRMCNLNVVANVHRGTKEQAQHLYDFNSIFEDFVLVGQTLQR